MSLLFGCTTHFPPLFFRWWPHTHNRRRHKLTYAPPPPIPACKCPARPAANPPFMMRIHNAKAKPVRQRIMHRCPRYPFHRSVPLRLARHTQSPPSANRFIVYCMGKFVISNITQKHNKGSAGTVCSGSGSVVLSAPQLYSFNASTTPGRGHMENCGITNHK